MRFLDFVPDVFVDCKDGKTDSVLRWLSSPENNPNIRDNSGDSLLHKAAEIGNEEILKILMSDSRLNPNEGNRFRQTPLWKACHRGQIKSVRILLASRRPIQTETLGATLYRAPRQDRTAIEVARYDQFYEGKGEEIAELIEEYKENPSKVSLRLRVELGIARADASRIFALVIFLCDGYFVLHKHTLFGYMEKLARPLTACFGHHVDKSSKNAERFLSIASRLPLDLQIVLANRTQGVARDLIPSKDKEHAFQELAFLLSKK